MKQLLSLTLLLYLSGCGDTPINIDTNTILLDTNNTTEDIVPNADTTATTIRSHNQGKNCFLCHDRITSSQEATQRVIRDDEGEEDDENFSSGGTLFTTLNVSNQDSHKYAYGYTLRLVLENTGTIINYNSISNGTGNFHATFNTGSVNNYTAEVLDAKGNVVNSSLKNSHDISRLSCNTCHSEIGTNGAPGRVVTYNYSAYQETYEK